MKKPFLTVIVIIMFSFCVKAQDDGFNNFVKKEGFVKFTDTGHLPSHVKRYHHLIESFFSRNHFDKKAIYIESSSVKVDNGFSILGLWG